MMQSALPLSLLLAACLVGSPCAQSAPERTTIAKKKLDDAVLLVAQAARSGSTAPSPRFSTLFEEELRDPSFHPLLVAVTREVFSQRFAEFFSDANHINASEAAGFAALARFVLVRGPFSKKESESILLSIEPSSEQLASWRADPEKLHEGWLQGLAVIAKEARPSSGWADSPLATVLTPFLRLGFERKDPELHAALLGQNSPFAGCRPALLAAANQMLVDANLSESERLAFANRYTERRTDPEGLLLIRYDDACAKRDWITATDLAKELTSSRITNDPEKQRVELGRVFAGHFPASWPSIGSVTDSDAASLAAAFKTFLAVVPQSKDSVLRQAEERWSSLVEGPTEASSFPAELQFVRALGVGSEKVEDILTKSVVPGDGRDALHRSCAILLRLRSPGSGNSSLDLSRFFSAVVRAARRDRDWYVLTQIANEQWAASDQAQLRQACTEAVDEAATARDSDLEYATQFFEQFRDRSKLGLEIPPSVRRLYLDHAFAAQDFTAAASHIVAWSAVDASISTRLTQELSTHFCAYLEDALVAGGTWSISAPVRQQLDVVLPVLKERHVEVRDTVLKAALAKDRISEALAWCEEWAAVANEEVPVAAVGKLRQRLVELLPKPGSMSPEVAARNANHAAALLKLDPSQEKELQAASVARLAACAAMRGEPLVSEATFAKAARVPGILHHLQLDTHVGTGEQAIQDRVDRLLELFAIEGASSALLDAAADALGSAVATDSVAPILKAAQHEGFCKAFREAGVDLVGKHIGPLGKDATSLSARATLLAGVAPLQPPSPGIAQAVTEVARGAFAQRMVAPITTLVGGSNGPFHSVLRDALLQALDEALRRDRPDATAVDVAVLSHAHGVGLAASDAVEKAAEAALRTLADGDADAKTHLGKLLPILAPTARYRTLLAMFSLAHPLPPQATPPSSVALLPSAAGQDPTVDEGNSGTGFSTLEPPQCPDFATDVQAVLQARDAAMAQDYPIAVCSDAFRYYYHERRYFAAYAWLAHTPAICLTEADEPTVQALQTWASWRSSLQELVDSKTTLYLQVLRNDEHGKQVAIARFAELSRPRPDSPHEFPCEIFVTSGTERLHVETGTLRVAVGGLQMRLSGVDARHRHITALTVQFPLRAPQQQVFSTRAEGGERVVLAQDAGGSPVLLMFPPIGSVALREVYRNFSPPEIGDPWLVDGGRIPLAGMVITSGNAIDVRQYTSEAGCWLTGAVYMPDAQSANIYIRLDHNTQRKYLLGPAPVDIGAAMQAVLPQGLPAGTQAIEFHAEVPGSRRVGPIMLENLRLRPAKGR